MRLMPHPPALLLSKKINSLPLGSLNWSTSFCRLVTVIVPSRRKNPYLTRLRVSRNFISSPRRTSCFDTVFRRGQAFGYNYWWVRFYHSLTSVFGAEILHGSVSLRVVAQRNFYSSPLQDKELATPFCPNCGIPATRPSSSPRTGANVVCGQKVFWAFEIAWKIQQVGMIA